MMLADDECNAGVPVIVMDLGSCREVIENRQTGLLVTMFTKAVQSLGKLGNINREACREHVRQRFSINTMVAGYERVDAKILDQQASKHDS